MHHGAAGCCLCSAFPIGIDPIEISTSCSIGQPQSPGGVKAGLTSPGSCISPSRGQGYSEVDDTPIDTIGRTNALNHCRSWRGRRGCGNCCSGQGSMPPGCLSAKVDSKQWASGDRHRRFSPQGPAAVFDTLQQWPPPGFPLQHTASQVSRLFRHPHIVTNAVHSDSMLGVQRSARLGLCGLPPAPSPLRSRAAALR